MKTLISILVLFSTSLFAITEKTELHPDTEYYSKKIFDLIPSIENIDEIDLYEIRWMLQGFNRNNLIDQTIVFYNLFMKRVNEASDKEKDNFYRNNDQVLSPYVVANYKKNGFDEGYKYLLTLTEWDFVNGLEYLWSELFYEKNEVKLIFLLDQHKDNFRKIEYRKEELFEILIETNELSANLLFEEIKNNFFNTEISELTTNHKILVKYCLKFEDIECLEKYLARENEFKTESMHKVTFEENVTEIIYGLIEMEQFQNADQYIKKYLSSGLIRKSGFATLFDLYPKTLEIYAEVVGAVGTEIEELRTIIKIESLIQKHRDLEGEEKHKIYDELTLLIFNNGSKYPFGGSDSEKINNMFFDLAYVALDYKNEDLAHSLAINGAVNTRLEDFTLTTKELEDLIHLLISTENYDYAYRFTNSFNLNEGLKNYIYAKMARAAARNGNLEWSKNAMDAWLKYMDVEPEIKKLWFKHKDDVVVYDKHLAVNLLINSAKSYFDSATQDEVRIFVKDFIDRDVNASIFQWQTTDIENFLKDLMKNNMHKEAVDLAKWYVEKYEEPEIDRLSSFGVNMEEFKFDFIEKVFVNLVIKGDLTSAFFILDYIDPSKVEDFLTKNKIEKKQKELLLRGGEIIKDKNTFNQYLEYFSVDQKFNLLTNRVNTINGNWW